MALIQFYVFMKPLSHQNLPSLQVCTLAAWRLNRVRTGVKEKTHISGMAAHRGKLLKTFQKYS